MADEFLNEAETMEGEGGEALNRTGELIKRVLEENRQLKALMRERKRSDARSRMDSDLKAIRKIDPSIKSIDDLDAEYFELVKNGIDGLTAFMALKAKGENARRKSPPKVGRVVKSHGAQKDYFTAKELNMLSAKELDNPKVLKKALKSMVKSKN